MGDDSPDNTEPLEGFIPEGPHAYRPQNSPDTQGQNDIKEFEERSKELGVLKQALSEAYLSSMRSAVLDAGIPLGRHEIFFSSGNRLSSHLLSFDDAPQIGPHAEVSIALWEEEKEGGSSPENVISVDRIIFFDKQDKQWKVYRSQILVNDEFQRRGIGSKVLADEEITYKELGISEVFLKAGEPVGLYNNAREGFDFADPIIRDRYNQELVKRVLLMQKKMDVVSVTLGKNGENILPISQIFSAPELTQLHAFNSMGEEVLLDSLRPKKEKEKEIRSKQIADQCYAAIGVSPSSEARKMLKVFWDGDALLSMKQAENLKEVCLGKIDYTKNFLNSHRLPGYKEALEVLNNSKFLEVFLGVINALSENDFMVTEKYPLGKALFLDSRPKSYQSYWYGKKKMAGE